MTRGRCGSLLRSPGCGVGNQGSDGFTSIVWAIGMPLHEETLVDHRFGRIMNANIANIMCRLTPTCMTSKVIFVEEPDDSPLRAPADDADLAQALHAEPVTATPRG